MSLDTPVAMFIFNRPLQTARVFARIAQAKPKELFLVADGPRDHSEHGACQAARSLVSEIDWDCQIHRNYSDVNLGCKRRMSSGITWVFSHVERAILLEDDCLPDASFFPYCTQLLDRYQDNERVMTVGGNNFQFGANRTADSYYFSAVHHIWGWATWRRAWNHFDVEMKQWPFVAETDFPGDFIPAYAAAREKRLMAQTYAGKLDTWDVQWIFACWMRRALCVLPGVNLVSNIGFGPAATHCKKTDAFAAVPAEAISFPLRHPSRVDVFSEADEAFLQRRENKAA